jgi:4a-hydroxytetrahydrobiopterin dehydratase
MESLNNLKCVPCRGDEPPASLKEIRNYSSQIPDWEVKELDGTKRLERSFKFKDFKQALLFTNKIGKIAEKEGHHPVITTQWGKVKVSWWTHKIKGLHRNDFIMAAKTDEIYNSIRK